MRLGCITISPIPPPSLSVNRVMDILSLSSFFNLSLEKSHHRQHQQLHQSGVNFAIILHAAFTPSDPKSAKRQSNQALLGSASVKATRKHVDEIDPAKWKECNPPNISIDKMRIKKFGSDFDDKSTQCIWFAKDRTANCRLFMHTFSKYKEEWKKIPSVWCN